MEKIIKRKGQEYTMLYDDEDDELFNQYKWRASILKGKKVNRVIATIGTSYKLFHREVMNVTDPKVFVDHINGNPLDNRKCNLRLCTNAENCRNKKKIKGKNKYKGTFKWGKYWYARIAIDNLRITISAKFKTEIEAAKAYDEAARKYHGEFAKTNF